MYSALANTDIAHTIGNVTFIMVEYIRSLFPEHFFNYTHLSTKIAYTEFMNEEAQLQQRLIKKQTPILIVKPRPVSFDDDIFLSHTPWMWPIWGTQNDLDRSDYIRCFRDNENDITLGYKLNRMRVQCLVTMMFTTEIQQQNIYMQLRNRFERDRPYWMKTSTEIQVPHGIMEVISALSGKPMIEPESGSPREFLNYLMMHANKYFTYKQNSGKNRDDFFLYYPQTLEWVFTDFDVNDPSRKGQTNEYADINFTFTSEFNTIGMFQLSTEKDNQILEANKIVRMDEPTGQSIVPMFTVDKIFKTEDENGFKLFFTNIFNIDAELEPDVPDVLDLKPVFKDKALKEILAYYDRNGLPYETLFNFIIMQNNKRLSDKMVNGRRDYKLDLHGERIVIYNKNPSATYRLLVYVNNLKIMQMMNDVNHLTESYEGKEQNGLKGESR